MRLQPSRPGYRGDSPIWWQINKGPPRSVKRERGTNPNSVDRTVTAKAIRGGLRVQTRSNLGVEEDCQPGPLVNSNKPVAVEGWGRGGGLVLVT